MYKDDNELFSIKICKLKDKHSKIQKIYTYYMYKNLLFKLAKGAKLFKIMWYWCWTCLFQPTCKSLIYYSIERNFIWCLIIGNIWKHVKSRNSLLTVGQLIELSLFSWIFLILKSLLEWSRQNSLTFWGYENDKLSVNKLYFFDACV